MTYTLYRHSVVEKAVTPGDFADLNPDLRGNLNISKGEVMLSAIECAILPTSKMLVLPRVLLIQLFCLV